MIVLDESNCLFANLSLSNKFLFRVCHDLSASRIRYDTAGRPEVVAAAYHDLPLIDSTVFHEPFSTSLLVDAFRHSVWGNREPTQFVTLTFSLEWAVWMLDKQQKYHDWRGREDMRFRLIVVDAVKLEGLAETAYRMLKQLEKRRPPGLVKLPRTLANTINYARRAQEVLAFGGIPSNAVVQIIEWKDLKPFIPRWLDVDLPFLRKGAKMSFAKAAKAFQSERQKTESKEVARQTAIFVAHLAGSNTQLTMGALQELILRVSTWAI